MGAIIKQFSLNNMVTIKEMFDIDHTYAIHILPTSTACFPGNRKIAWFLRHNEIIDMEHSYMEVSKV